MLRRVQRGGIVTDEGQYFPRVDRSHCAMGMPAWLAIAQPTARLRPASVAQASLPERATEFNRRLFVSQAGLIPLEFLHRLIRSAALVRWP